VERLQCQLEPLAGAPQHLSYHTSSVLIASSSMLIDSSSMLYHSSSICPHTRNC
jgi:hypothetical protein